MNTWTKRWAELRKKELVSYPESFPIHGAYTSLYPKEDLKSGFEALYELCGRMYEDMAEDAAAMLLPAYDREAYRYLSREEKLTREASYRYAKLLYALGSLGEMNEQDELCISVSALKELLKAMKITNAGAYLKVMTEYGFVIEGLEGKRIGNGSKTSWIISGHVLKV